jgi:two-component system NtrC family sensor kinase
MIERDEILLVDDNPENLKVLAGILKPKGYIIRLAMSGMKAIKSIKAKAPNLVLLDVQMPGMDGYETCRVIKSHGEMAEIPIIFVSALTEVVDKIRAFEVGAVDFIEKPFHFDEVLARVNTHLTIRKQSEQLQQALLQVSQAQTKLIQSDKMFSLGILTAGIAHEINNPINYINAGAIGLELDLIDLLKLLDYYETIDFEERLPDVAQKIEILKGEIEYNYIKNNLITSIKDIKMGATRTAEIISGLKRFSRVDNDQHFKVNVNELIRSNLKIVKRISKKQIKLNCDFQENINEINGYSGPLNQLFMNLIMNAQQAIEKAGIINITTLNKGEGVTITVSDNGSGINEELGDRIFEPFVTTKKVGEGTGLGLYISFGIVENHGGTITYTSERNEGTSFRVYLPNKMKE